MIPEKTINKVLRKKILWSEIKAKEQEYKRLQSQINELEKAKADISFEVQKRLQESQEIAEYLDKLQYDQSKPSKHECAFYVNSDWTGYSNCVCGKKHEDK